MPLEPFSRRLGSFAGSTVGSTGVTINVYNWGQYIADGTDGVINVNKGGRLEMRDGLNRGAYNDNDITINGNIHSNSDINMKNAVLAPGRTATAVRKIEPSNKEGWYKSIALDMPSYSSLDSVIKDMDNKVVHSGSIIKKADEGFQSLYDRVREQFLDNKDKYYLSFFPN